MLEKIRDILLDVLDRDDLDLTLETRPNQVEEWDSMAQIQILVALENEFGIKFTLEESQGIACVGDIVEVVERKMG